MSPIGGILWNLVSVLRMSCCLCLSSFVKLEQYQNGRLLTNWLTYIFAIITFIYLFDTFLPAPSLASVLLCAYFVENWNNSLEEFQNGSRLKDDSRNVVMNQNTNGLIIPPLTDVSVCLSRYTYRAEKRSFAGAGNYHPYKEHAKLKQTMTSYHWREFAKIKYIRAKHKKEQREVQKKMLQ